MVKPHCYTKEWTDQLRERYPRTDPGLLEKTIHAFELLALLVRSGRLFVFKGGTALLLHMNDLDRLSIDIDIVGSFAFTELEAIIKDSVFLKKSSLLSGISISPTGDLKRNVTIKLNSCGIGPSLNSGHSLANACRITTLDNKKKTAGARAHAEHEIMVNPWLLRMRPVRFFFIF